MEHVLSKKHHFLTYISPKTGDLKRVTSGVTNVHQVLGRPTRPGRTIIYRCRVVRPVHADHMTSQGGDGEEARVYFIGCLEKMMATLKNEDNGVQLRVVYHCRVVRTTDA